MPIYEYACEKCGETIEVMQKMSDPDIEKHEGCGGAFTRLFSIPGIQTRGSGERVTDQQSENSVKAKEKAKKSAPIIGAPVGKRSRSE